MCRKKKQLKLVEKWCSKWCKTVVLCHQKILNRQCLNASIVQLDDCSKLVDKWSQCTVTLSYFSLRKKTSNIFSSNIIEMYDKLLGEDIFGLQKYWKSARITPEETNTWTLWECGFLLEIYFLRMPAKLIIIFRNFFFWMMVTSK